MAAQLQDLSFDFVAPDGYQYPCDVEFVRRLANVVIVGLINEKEFGDRADEIGLFYKLPRMRVVITVHGTEAAFGRRSPRSLRGAAAALADQIHAIATATGSCG